MFPRTGLGLRLLGSALTIPLGWLVITVVAAASTLAALAPARGSPIAVSHWYLAGAVLVAGAFGSLILHELGHAAAARRLGLPPGHLALYPFGSTRAGFDDPGTPRQSALVALAGPAISLALGLILGLTWWLLPDAPALLRRGVGALALVNLVLGVGNLLPGYPLDGGRVFRALVWYLHDSYATGTRAAVVYGQIIAVLILMAGLLLLSAGQDRAVWGLWLVLLGWSMSRTARAELTHAFVVAVGTAISAGEIVAGINPRVAAGQSIDEAVDALLGTERAGPALVYDGDTVVGVLPIDRLRRVRRADWHRCTAAEAMLPLAGLPRLADDASLRDVLTWLADAEADALLVVRGDEVVGALDRQLAVTRLLERARARQRLRHG